MQQLKKSLVAALALILFNHSGALANPLVEQYLLNGKLAAGESALTKRLQNHPRDDQARFGLGLLQFLTTAETVSQSLYRHGLRTYSDTGFVLPFLSLPVVTNLESEKISYLQLRQIIEQLHKNLLRSEATLASITDEDVRLPLHFGMIQLDLSGDQKAGSEKSLWKVYAKLTRQTDIPLEKAQKFYIKFDRGDVHWLRGYCHLLASVCCIYLAYDSKEIFERTGHMFFTKVESPYDFLKNGKHLRLFGSGDVEIFDLIAFVHLVNCEVVDSQKMNEALTHLQAVVDESRESWKRIMAETDDDHEWLPNPKQTGVMANAKVTEAMVASWSEIMNESEKILKGELLIPFWRGAQTSRGINLRKLFLQPRKFDLVLWIQGTDAAPYLETGTVTKDARWTALRREFGGHFPGFALWFN